MESEPLKPARADAPGPAPSAAIEAPVPGALYDLEYDISEARRRQLEVLANLKIFHDEIEMEWVFQTGVVLLYLFVGVFILCSYFTLPWNCDDCLPVYLLGLGAWSLVWAVCLIVAHYVSLSRLAHMEANAIEPDESFVRFFAVFVLFPLFAGELVNVGWSFFGAFATYSSEVSCGRGLYLIAATCSVGIIAFGSCFLPTRATGAWKTYRALHRRVERQGPSYVCF